MLRVSNLTGRRIGENHSEPLVNRQPVILMGRENANRIGDDTTSTLSAWASAHVQAEPALTRYSAPIGGQLKRAFDAIFAFITLILMLPLMLMIAALIYVTTRGPVFYVQRRVGFNRITFNCYKFRTMVTDADTRLKLHLATHPEAAADWAETQKLRSDPRITWIGNILRKSSLDELPQLINIVRGDMSCIGPRPVVAEELERYGDFQMDYLRAKPGLTGMWQVNGRSSTTYAHRINCDRYYARRWSLALDLGILFKTIPAVLKFDETA